MENIDKQKPYVSIIVGDFNNILWRTLTSKNLMYL